MTELVYIVANVYWCVRSIEVRLNLCLNVFFSDSPHSEPPLVDEPAPDTISDTHNSDDGEFKNY